MTRRQWTASANDVHIPPVDTEYPECPYCGEHGEPREIVSREYQGESPHGGIVESVEQMCSICVADQKRRECEAEHPVDNRLCGRIKADGAPCGKPVGEHDLGEDWVLRADGCEGFEEKKMGLWYLSFVKAPEDVFLGACVVNGTDPTSAAKEASRLGCNPGGEVAAFDVTEFPNPFPVGKLMSKVDIERIDGEPPMRLGDMSEE